MMKSLFFASAALLFFTSNLIAAEVSDLKQLRLSDIQYEGAFRLPATTYGTSSLNYSEGPIEYNATNNSLFIVGHAHHQNIAEFSIPGLVKSTEISHLPMASEPNQHFSSILDRATEGNPQNLNRVGGLEYFRIGEEDILVVNAYEYYDAPGDNTQTTLIARDASQLESCRVDGYFTFEGGAGHTSGWISPIPSDMQTALGGDYITGQSSGIPIISRTSVGPSAFSFNHTELLEKTDASTPVSTTKLLDFSLGNPLHDDLSNADRDNDIWTHLSRVVYGMVVPGTRTYLTIGQSGGHESGVCYKCTQNTGRLCGGYCAPDAEDYYHYYWLWDLQDLIDVKNGSKNSYDIRPYEYGEFTTPFATNNFGGGTYDPVGKLLYLSVLKADREQGTYSNPPVIVAFSFNVSDDPDPEHIETPKNLLLLKN